MSDDPVISLDHVSVRYANVAALHDLSFSVAPGAFVALLGANGAGKTTVLHAIAGLLQPQSGEVRVMGSAGARPRSERRRLGYVSQVNTGATQLPFSVKDAVSMGRSGVGLFGPRVSKADRLAVRNAIRDVGLTHLMDRPLSELSGGERQRVELARTLCQGADVLLLDEPVANLDLGGRCEVLDLIEDLHRRHGLTILLVLHDLAYLPARCTRALVLDHGTMAWDGPTADVISPDVLELIYGSNTERVMRDLKGLFAS